MDIEGCKSCSENVRTGTSISQDQINEAIEKLAKVKRIKFVNDDVYEQRLSICRECIYLEFGITCMQCGCIVHIKAKLADAGCPLTKQKRWNAIIS